MVQLRMFAISTVLAAVVSISFCCDSATAQAGESVLLDFTASWCQPCQTMAPTIQRLAQEGMPVRKIDFDHQRELATRYGVTNVPTFVMVVDGKEVDRVVGATSYRRLKQMFDRARIQPPGAGARSARGQSLDPSGFPSRPTAHSEFAASNPGAAPSVARQVGPPSNLTGPTPNRTQFPSAPRTTTLATGSPSTGVDPLIQSSVRIRVEDQQGHAFGTGTIIDSRSGEALVLTCGHLFRDSGGKGPVSIDLFATGSPVTVQGNLIDYDLERDLAILSIKVNQPVRVAPIAGAGYSATRGQSVTSVGCDNGQLPSVRRTQVTQLDRYAGPSNIEAAGAPVQGRSGGGLFDSEGRLIGVCFAADEQDDEGLYSAASSIHAMLDRHSLSDIYRRTPAASTNNLSTLASNGQPIPLPNNPGGMNNMPSTMPTTASTMATTTAPSNRLGAGSPSSVAAAATNPPANFSSGTPAGSGSANPQPNALLSSVETAALTEIQARSKDAEVICIIRPKDPAAKSEVIVLDSASPQFLNRLNANRLQSMPQLTSMQVPNTSTSQYPTNRSAATRGATTRGATTRQATTARRAVSETERLDAMGWNQKPIRR